jgi:PKD repeat protein
MVLLAAVPLAMAAEHYVPKGDQGPRANAVTWEFRPLDYGMWRGHIVNDGLRSLTVDVYDNTTGAPEQIMHQRIKFADYDAYPIGMVDTKSLVVAPSHKYLVTVTPFGPKGSSCTVDDGYGLSPPVAMFTVTISYMMVLVDGSTSYDVNGWIVSYAWDFCDGSGATGVTATHTYAAPGYYTITLTVTDNEGFTGSASRAVWWGPPIPPPIAIFDVSVNWMTVYVDGSASYDADGTIVSYAWDFGDGSTMFGTKTEHTYSAYGTYTITLRVTDNDGNVGSASEPVTLSPPPILAHFTYTVDGPTVNVDASASGADGGIVSYDWNWGDGTTGVGMTASHTYAIAKSMPVDMNALSSMGRGPGPPYVVFGTTYAADGATPLPDTSVTVTDLRTGNSTYGISDANGYYEVNWLVIDGGWLDGDVIKVTAVNGALSGTNESVSSGFYLWLNVTLADVVEPIVKTITLTVTDNLGQTGTMSQTVTLYP